MDERFEDWSARFKEAGGEEKDFPIKWGCDGQGNPYATVTLENGEQQRLSQFEAVLEGWTFEGYVKARALSNGVPDEVIEACRRGPEFVRAVVERLRN